MSDKNKKELPPNNRLIVNNLDYDTTESSLAEYFAKYGKVLETEIPVGRQNKRSRGFGFVTFSSIEEATEANKEEHEHELDGRKLRTSFAKIRDREGKVAEESSSSSSSSTVGGKKLYIGKLPLEINEEELRDYFSKFGKVEDAFLSTIKFASLVNGYPQHKGFGFVTFEIEDDANKVVKEKNHSIKGTEISVRKAKPQEKEERSQKSKNTSSSSDDDKKPVVVKRKEGGKKHSNNNNNNNEHKDHKKSEKKNDNKNEHKKVNNKEHNNKNEKKHENKEHKEHNEKPKTEEKKHSQESSEKKAPKQQQSSSKKSNNNNNTTNVNVKAANKKPNPVFVSSKPAENPWNKASTTSSSSESSTATKEFPSLGNKKKGQSPPSNSKGKDEKGKEELN